MVEWNGIFRLFRFSGILGQPREVHPKFRNEIPENVCSIRSQTRNFRNFWSNGKRPWTPARNNAHDNLVLEAEKRESGNEIEHMVDKNYVIFPE